MDGKRWPCLLPITGILRDDEGRQGSRTRRRIRRQLTAIKEMEWKQSRATKKKELATF